MFIQTLIILFLGSHINGQVITTLMCGGTIITKKDILPAARIEPAAVIWVELLPSYRGIVGSYYWNSNDIILVPFTGYHIHEVWNPWTIKDDIGILVTAGIPLSERVNVLPLNFNLIGEKEKCVVTGNVGFMMPTPDRLQILHVSTINGAECVRRVLQMLALGWWSPPVDPHREICTFHSPGHGMCHGDSGSALRHKKTGSLIGLVSWGYPCAVGGPDVFVRLSWYKPWVLNKVTKNLK